MAQVIKEALNLQRGSTLIHKHVALLPKLTLIALALASLFMGLYAMIALLVVNTALLVYAGARRLLLVVFSLWGLLSLVIVALDYVFATLTISVVYNLIHAFTTFTALSLFLATTPPSHVRALLGPGALYLSYLYLNYSLKLVEDLVYALKARGMSFRLSLREYQYLLRAFTTLLAVRIAESTEALRARGLES